MQTELGYSLVIAVVFVTRSKATLYLTSTYVQYKRPDESAETINFLVAVYDNRICALFCTNSFLRTAPRVSRFCPVTRRRLTLACVCLTSPSLCKILDVSCIANSLPILLRLFAVLSLFKQWKRSRALSVSQDHAAVTGPCSKARHKDYISKG